MRVGGGGMAPVAPPPHSYTYDVYMLLCVCVCVREREREYVPSCKIGTWFRLGWQKRAVTSSPFDNADLRWSRLDFRCQNHTRSTVSASS